MRQLVRAVAVLAVVVVGWTQPLPAANAAFTTSATASSAVTTHTLETPVLDCDPGGLLNTTVRLTWPSVASATTSDPYGPAGSYRADGYEIYRATGSGSFILLASPGRTATSYNDSPGGLVTSYRYQLRAKKEGWRGGFSNVVTANVTSVLFVGVSTTCNA